ESGHSRGPGSSPGPRLSSRSPRGPVEHTVAAKHRELAIAVGLLLVGVETAREARTQLGDGGRRQVVAGQVELTELASLADQRAQGREVLVTDRAAGQMQALEAASEGRVGEVGERHRREVRGVEAELADRAELEIVDELIDAADGLG